MPELTRPEEIRQVLETARTVAVLGANVKPQKPAFYVPDYLHGQGYRILPVNPVYAGRSQWDETFVSELAELEAPVDVVDVFRLPQLIPDHLPDILAMDPLPKVVWFQLGIRNDESAAKLVDAGIDVIQDHCMLADHRRMGIGRVGD